MRTTLLLFLFTISAWSQSGNLTGKVTFGTDELAYGSTVIIKGTQKYAIVNDFGRYEFKGLKYGEYILETSSMEGQTRITKINVNKPNTEFNISLDRNAPKDLQEVVIKKSSIRKEIMEKGFAVNVIETQEAAQRNLQTNDLLDRSGGVRIRQNGGLGSSVTYNINGMSGNAIRIFIDGIPIQTYGASFSLNSIPPALIERIEVYKGVVPGYLADDSLGGAINVILKKGSKNMIAASVSYGSFNTIQSNFSTTYRDKSGFTVKANGFQNYSDNDYEVWGRFVYNILPNGRYDYIRAKRFESMYRSYGGRLEAGFTDVKWADNFSISYNGSEDYNQIQHGQYMTKPYKGRFSESAANVFSINYNKKDFLIKKLDFSLISVYSHRNDVINDTVKWNYNWDGEKALGLYGEPTTTTQGAQQGAPTILHQRSDIFNTRAGLTYTITDNHKVLVNNMFYSVDRNDLDEMLPELVRNFLATRDLEKNVFSASYEMQAFKSRLKANLFLKNYALKTEQVTPRLVNQNGQSNLVFEADSRNTNFTGYGFAGSYSFLQKAMLMLSAERAIRLPNENEIFGLPGENVLSNPNLGPEQSENLNVGLRLGPYLINHHKFSFYGNAFWRNIQDKIVRQISDRVNEAVQATPFINLGRSQSVGFETSVQYSFKDKLFAGVNLSKFNSVYKQKYDANGNLLSYYNKQLPNEPFFNINGNLQYNFKNLIQSKSELNLYYYCGYVAPFYTSWLEIDRTTAQFPQDLGLSYAFPNKQFIVSFDAKNIFDEQVYDNFAAQKPGRAFYIKLNYTISKF
ncbi:TonB-dependent receptor plug domain-containing protein [Flavobacterium sp. DG2-3]|uniref:TonB-dependent receptor n=1 Tax=Flavobacterium sp. DG2-3 TaxID=3068317 RepID=UPI00273E4BBE|nr:TonB-dependent receptor plug domain-containing protein [Flavobacterium sp. DG2-3]MDP5199773.1 TonB-dependent receptor [Flavobacterium sp. DG2-3]